MKVLFTLDTLRGGGTETSILHLIHHFSAETECTFCYFYPPHDLQEAFLKAPCELVFLDLKGSYDFFQGIKQLKKLVATEKYDVIVTSLYRSGIMSRIVGLLTGVPVIDTMVNDSYGPEKRKEFKGINMLKFYLVFFLDRITASIPKKWISNSNYLSQALGGKLGVSKSTIQVLYRGRDTSKIGAWESRMPQPVFRFISIGRLFSQKGQTDLLHSFQLFHHNYPNSTLTIYGEGPERMNLEHLCSQLQLSDAVFLPGHSESAWEQLYVSHCFVLPSLYEGFSGALVEALMSGIPLIASDIPMNQEAVTSEINGLLYPVSQIEALYASMKNVYTNYTEAILRGEKARAIALEKYDIKMVACQYEALIKNEVIKKGL
mgnify:CR=1 FL=1